MQADRFGVFERTSLPGDIDLLVWNTPKFKTTTIRFSLLENLNEQASARALCASLLKRGCRSCPDMMSLSRRLEELYGAALAIDVSRRGERQNTSVRLQVVNDHFLGRDTKALSGGLDLLREVLAEPVIESGGFRSSEFEQERVNLVRGIRGLLDDKISYAHQRLVEEMFRGEPYSRFELGDEQTAASLDRQDTYQFHRRRLATAPLELFAVGKLGDGDLDCIRETAASLGDRGEISAVAPETFVQGEAPRTVVDEYPVSQSKLLIGYRVDTRGLDDTEYFALGLFNAILGGGSQAKLFKEVRENRGLAYYASSALDRLKGFFVLTAGVGASCWEEAADVMRQQVTDMRKGLFTDDEMNVARSVLMNSLNSVNDSPGQAIELVSVARATGRPAGVDSIAATLRNLTRDDVVRVAALPVEGTSYLLKGTDDHGTEAG